eukprot:7835148-Alexandrium_andersonii.AAC.1
MFRWHPRKDFAARPRSQHARTRCSPCEVRARGEAAVPARPSGHNISRRKAENPAMLLRGSWRCPMSQGARSPLPWTALRAVCGIAGACANPEVEEAPLQRVVPGKWQPVFPRSAVGDRRRGASHQPGVPDSPQPPQGGQRFSGYGKAGDHGIRRAVPAT